MGQGLTLACLMLSFFEECIEEWFDCVEDRILEIPTFAPHFWLQIHQKVDNVGKKESTR